MKHFKSLLVTCSTKGLSYVKWKIGMILMKTLAPVIISDCKAIRVFIKVARHTHTHTHTHTCMHACTHTHTHIYYIFTCVTSDILMSSVKS